MKYNDKVRIKEWFYEGQEGTLKEAMKYQSWTLAGKSVWEETYYNIILNDDKYIQNIPESYLELIK